MSDEDVVDNVIHVDFGNGLPTTLEQSRELIYAIRETHVIATLEAVADIFFQYLSAAGFDFFEDAAYKKDVAFYLESLRSMIAKKAGVEHPFQRIADETFTQDAEGLMVWTATGKPTTIVVMEQEEESAHGA